LLVPYLRYRTKVLPLAPGPRAVIVLPQALIADWCEIAVLGVASLQFGTLLL
jgi:hypothetical protein